MDNVPSLTTQIKQAIGELRTDNRRAHKLRAAAEEELREQFQKLADRFDAKLQGLHGVLDSLNGAVQ